MTTLWLKEDGKLITQQSPRKPCRVRGREFNTENRLSQWWSCWEGGHGDSPGVWNIRRALPHLTSKTEEGGGVRRAQRQASPRNHGGLWDRPAAQGEKERKHSPFFPPSNFLPVPLRDWTPLEVSWLQGAGRCSLQRSPLPCRAEGQWDWLRKKWKWNGCVWHGQTLNTSQMTECWRTCRHSFPREDVREGHSREKELHGQNHGCLKLQAPPEVSPAALGGWADNLRPFPSLSSASEAPFRKMLSHVALLSFMADTNFPTVGNWEVRWDTAPRISRPAASDPVSLPLVNSLGGLASPERSSWPVLVTFGIWVSSRPRALMRMLMPREERAAQVGGLVALHPSPESLALAHAVRIYFSHSPAVKFIFMMIEDFV